MDRDAHFVVIAFVAALVAVVGLAILSGRAPPIFFLMGE